MKTLFIIPTLQGVIVPKNIIVPTLQRWNAAVDAPASSTQRWSVARRIPTPERGNYAKRDTLAYLNEDAGASSDAFQRWSVGTIKTGVHA